MPGRPPKHADVSGRPCIFGEVLFDHFPDGRRVLGGAPFNVAWHLQAFGESPLLVSRIGDDADGAAVAHAMDDWDMERAGLQTDPRLPTGRVQVSIEDGEPSYDIVHPSAWDAIEPPGLDARCLLLYHGTLALRDDRARQAWRQLRRGRPRPAHPSPPAPRPARNRLCRRQSEAALVAAGRRARGDCRCGLGKAQPP